MKWLPLLLLIAASLFVSLPALAQVNPPLSGQSQWLTSNGVVAPGQSGVVLEVTVVNSGTYPLSDIRLTPQNSSPLLLYGYSNGSPSFYVSELQPGSAYSFTVTLQVSSSAHQGVYNLKVSSSFIEDYQGVNFPASESFTVPVQVIGSVQLSATSVWGVPSSQVEVFPGESDVPLTILIENSGTVSATNVTLYLRSHFPIYFNQSRAIVGIVPAGGQSEVQVLAGVYPNASVGSYYVPLLVHFFQQNVSLNATVVVGTNVKVAGSVFGQQWADQGEEAGPNEAGVPIQFSLMYLGTLPTLYETVKVYLPQGFTNSTRGNYVVFTEPSMRSGEVFTLSFPVDIGSVPLGDYQFPVQVSWVVPEGEGQVVEVNQSSSFSLFLEGQSQVQATVLNTSLLPGGVNNLTIVLENSGSGPTYNVSLTIQAPQGLSVLEQPAEIPDIPAHTNYSMEIPLYVPTSDAGEPVTLTISGDYVDPAMIQLPLTLEVGLYVQQSTLRQEPILGSVDAQLQSGSTSNVTVSLVNVNPSPLYNVTLAFSSSEVDWLSPAQLEYHLIPSGGLVTFNATVTVPPGVQGVVPVQLTAQYYNKQGQSLLETTELTLYVQPSVQSTSPIVAYLHPSILLTGEPSTTQLVLINTANSPLYNLSVTLSSPSSYLNQTLITSSFVPPGGELSIPLQVYVPVSGSISFQFQAQYYDQQRTLHAESGSVGALATGSIDIVETGISTVPSVALPGSLVSVTATIVNYGTGTADGLLASVSPPRGLTVISGSTYYVGDVAPYTPTTFTFAFQVTNFTKPGTYIIPVNLTYTNSLDELQNSHLNISLTVASNATAFFHNFHSFSSGHSSLPKFALYVSLIVIVIVVVGVILGRRWSRRT